MSNLLNQRREINQVFAAHMFVQSRDGRYPVTDGWYPLLGLPGSLDVKRNAVLFCKLQESVEAEVQRFCLNAVIEKIRIHKSARVNRPDTMLVLASDLVREFEVCQAPIMPDVQQLIGAIHSGSKSQVPKVGLAAAPEVERP